MSVIIALIIAYLLGSVSTSILVSKFLKIPDPRTEGSGNAGATNILRIAGKKPAVVTMIGDIVKGLIAVWIGHIFHMHAFWLGLVGLAAVVGHVYPVWFGFKGGKGVATAGGVILGMSLFGGIVMGIVWGAVAFVTRYASLASIIAVIVAPFFLLFFAKAAFFIPTALIAALVIWKHKENIARLQSKTESKIEF